MVRHCQQCNVDISARPPKARYCKKCVERRQQTKTKKFHCSRCGMEMEERSPRDCDTCRISYLKADKEWRKNSGQGRATKAVFDAVRRGQLPNLREVEIQCEDCGVQRARDYDHRDYSYPLFVSALCRSCNLKRGRGKPRSDLQTSNSPEVA